MMTETCRVQQCGHYQYFVYVSAASSPVAGEGRPPSSCPALSACLSSRRKVAWFPSEARHPPGHTFSTHVGQRPVCLVRRERQHERTLVMERVLGGAGDATAHAHGRRLLF